MPADLEKLFDFSRVHGPVLFRVDAGRIPGLSFGHLERCAILSQGLRRAYGIRSRMFMRPLADGLARARILGEATLEYGGSVPTVEADALVIDLPYPPEPILLDVARERGWYVAVLDDTGRDLCQSDVVLNSSVLARPEVYPRTGRTLLGPENLILEERFLAARHTGSGNSKPQVLLTFGGSDPTGLTVKVLNAMASMEDTFDLAVVMGPGFVERSEVRRLVSSLKEGRFLVLDSPKDMLPLFTGCDLAVCAGGRTLYELHALSVPTVAVASSPLEAQAIRAFISRGWLLAGVDNFEPYHFAGVLNAALGRVSRERM